MDDHLGFVFAIHDGKVSMTWATAWRGMGKARVRDFIVGLLLSTKELQVDGSDWVIAAHHRVEELADLILLPDEVPLNGRQIKRALLAAYAAERLVNADGNKLGGGGRNRTHAVWDLRSLLFKTGGRFRWGSRLR